MNKNRMGFNPEDQEAQLDARNKEIVNKVKRFAGLLPQPAPGVDIDQRMAKNKKQELKPYDNEYVNKGAGDTKDIIAGGNVMDKVNAAYKAQQMKDLENLEQIGAFEEPDSEVNQRAARLRKLLGK